ncbi:MAG: MBL fold metallo-hydrolase [Verrucomicrobia bacterium]|nr:MBL fold metallo-hydrolase [Verrucomicrobiota bacterium]
MSLQLCVLASGSSGNCTYVGSEKTHILIDAGLSGKATTERLVDVGVDPESIHAICLTHEHDDHKASLHVLHRRYGVSLYSNSGTIEALSRNPKLNTLPWNVFTTGQPFTIGDLVLEPFRVPHDSYDPVGFVVSCGEVRVGVATDMGMATELIRQRLRNCGALVLESNHDETMLRESSRPWALKQRISGRQGHLSNEKAGSLIAEVAGDTLRTVFLAHLSRDCNTPDLAMRTVQQVLGREGCSHIDVKMTHASRASEITIVE